jgi:ABC-type multidrug transport system fused ATPase/permease subunit
VTWLGLVRTYEAPGPPNPASGSASTALIFVIVIAALYIGRDIFVPLALAVLLSFMLAPLLSWLQRQRVPRIPAVVGVVALAFTVVGIFAFVVAGQLTQLAENFPSYQSNLQAKIRAVKIGGAPDGLFGRISAMLQELGDEVARPSVPTAPAATFPSPTVGVAPIPVEIVERNSSPLQIVETVIGPLIAPLVTAGIVIVFVIFILLYRNDLRDRFIRLASVSDLNRTTQALRTPVRVAVPVDASRREPQLWIPIGIGLWLISVPYPLLGHIGRRASFHPHRTHIGRCSIACRSLSTQADDACVDDISSSSWSSSATTSWSHGSMARRSVSRQSRSSCRRFSGPGYSPIGCFCHTAHRVRFVLGRHVPQFAFLDVAGSERVLTPEESLHQRTRSQSRRSHGGRRRLPPDAFA